MWCWHRTDTRCQYFIETVVRENINVLETEQRKQLKAIRAHLDSLEDGGSRLIDI